MKTLHTIVLALAASGLAGCIGPVHPVVGPTRETTLGSIPIRSKPLSPGSGLIRMAVITGLSMMASKATSPRD